MKIRKVEESDFASLVEFNQNIYIKSDGIEESLNYRFFINPHNVKSHESIIALNENDKIIGQILLMCSKFRYNGNTETAVWGMDYVVDELYRGSPAGTVLCKKALKVEFHFGVGLTETSMAIHKVFGENIIGSVCKYIRLTGPFSFVKFIFPRLNNKYIIEYPEEIEIKDSRFVKVIDPAEINSKLGFWNDNILEFVRDTAFLKWRYFYYPDKYLVYKYISKNNKEDIISTTFFVARPIVWKNVNCLLLVDYRTSCDKDFFKIISATKELAKKLKVSAVITGCSFSGYKKILKRTLFLKFGTNLEIVSNYKEYSDRNSFDKDNILVTFGDSDCDFVLWQ